MITFYSHPPKKTQRARNTSWSHLVFESVTYFHLILFIFGKILCQIQNRVYVLTSNYTSLEKSKWFLCNEDSLCLTNMNTASILLFLCLLFLLNYAQYCITLVRVKSGIIFRVVVLFFQGQYILCVTSCFVKTF